MDIMLVALHQVWMMREKGRKSEFWVNMDRRMEDGPHMETFQGGVVDSLKRDCREPSWLGWLRPRGSSEIGDGAGRCLCCCPRDGVRMGTTPPCCMIGCLAGPGRMFGTPGLDMPGDFPAPANGAPAEGGAGKVGEEDNGEEDGSVGDEAESAGTTPP